MKTKIQEKVTPLIIKNFTATKATLSLLAGLLFGCQPTGQSSTDNPPGPIQQLYAANSRAEHLNCLAEDYRLFFKRVEGEGISKTQLAEMLTWDYALQPEKTIIDTLYYAADSAVLVSREENDFSRLIGYGGWTSKNTYLISKEKISRQLYIPMDSVSYKPFLQPAVKWLAENDSLALTEVYDMENKVLIRQDSSTAIIWKQLLNKWKQSTEQ